MGKELWEQEKGLLCLFNEGMNDIIKTMKSLENSSLLFAGVTETVKHEIKTQKADLLEPCQYLSPLY